MNDQTLIVLKTFNCSQNPQSGRFHSKYYFVVGDFYWYPDNLCVTQNQIFPHISLFFGEIVQYLK